MTDTAQPLAAAETAVVSKDEAFSLAADAFKVSLGQAEAPERARDDKGRFAPVEGEEIDAEELAQEAGNEAESQDSADDEQEAAEEAQPQAVDLPPSWPAEQAETWNSLPPETQALIAEREGQREAAVNAKFQEAANARKAFESHAAEASTIRAQAEGIIHNLLQQVVATPEPPLSMLDASSGDYDPDTYHLLKGQRDHQMRNAGHLHQLAGQFAALRDQQDQQATMARVQQINAVTKDAFLANCPDAGDQQKAPEVFQGLMDYAVSQGAPQDLFDAPTSALEWNLLWKAREYDRLQEAKAKVQTDPKPEQKKAGPAIRPGVATPASARKQAQNKQARDRLARTGSVADGAAVWKQFLR